MWKVKIHILTPYPSFDIPSMAREYEILPLDTSPLVVALLNQYYAVKVFVFIVKMSSLRGALFRRNPVKITMPEGHVSVFVEKIRLIPPE
jgi:hypothetical protein